MIRSYQSKDVDQLLDVWANASAVGHPFLSDEFLEKERSAIANTYLPASETWVWEENGQVVGFMSIAGDEVGALFVDPDRQRTGIGREFIEYAGALRGELVVEVFERNHVGRAFYAKVGFEPDTRQIHNETGFVMLRLRRPAADRVEASLGSA